MQRIIFILFCSVLFASCSKHRIGYINIQSVFNEFEYKRELEKELKGITGKRKFILDSLETNLKILNRKISSDKSDKALIAEFQILKEVYLKKQSMFEEEEQEMVKQYDERIVAQLNSYVKEFGKEKRYDLIYGANSSGNIMYADSALDLTKDVTKYINEKFKGKH
jgi:outer membrane protein